MSPCRVRQTTLALLLALVATFSALHTRVAFAATTITDCSDANAIEAQLEGGGDFVFDCGVVTITFDSSIDLFDPNTGRPPVTLTIDGGGTTTFAGGGDWVLFVASYSELHLKRLTIKDAPGGINMYDATVTISDSTFTNVGAPNRDGMIWAVGARLTITNSTFTGNQASNGGAISIWGSSTVDITSSTFSGNTVTRPGNTPGGGAISNQDIGNVTITDSVFTNNGGDNTVGGAIYNEGSLRITNSTFLGNRATFGGAIYNWRGDVDLVSSTLAGNEAGRGGAINNERGTVDITASTFSGNTLDPLGEGSAIANGRLSFSTTYPGGAVTITSSTFVDNTHQTLWHDSAFAMTISNSILVPAASGSSCAGAITSAGHNISSDASCAFTATGDRTNTFQFMGSLQDNSGPTLTYAPLAGGVGIDSGACPGETADQRGITRPQGAACDIGAVEDDTPAPETSFASPPPPTTLADTAFAFVSSEAGSTFECQLDSAAFGACSSPATYMDLTLGEHTFAVRATDRAGHVDLSPATHTWLVTAPPDMVPPVTTASTTPAANLAGWHRAPVTLTFDAADSSGSVDHLDITLAGAQTETRTTPGSHDAVTISAAGTTTVTVAATDAAGNQEAAQQLVVNLDRTAPTITQAPVLSFRLGSRLDPTTARLRIQWVGQDESGGSDLYSFGLRQSLAGGPFTSNPPTSTTPAVPPSMSRLRWVPIGSSVQYQVRAKDRAGNVSADSLSERLTPSIIDDTDTAVSYAAGWHAVASRPTALNGTLNWAGSAGVSATCTFSGTAVGWASVLGPNRGQVSISIDGGPALTVELYAATYHPRRVVWEAHGLDPNQPHMVVITVLATRNAASSGTRVDVDGFAVLR